MRFSNVVASTFVRVYVAPFVKLALDNLAKFEILARFSSFFRLAKEERGPILFRADGSLRFCE